MSIRLKSATIRGCMQMQAVDIDFPDPSLITVTGDFGTGKTGLGEIISRAVLGHSGRFTRLSDYVHPAAEKGLYVRVDMECNEKALQVEMGYRCSELNPRGEGLRFTYAGETIQRDLLPNTRKELTKIVQVSAALAEWSVFIDGDVIKFDKMSQTDCVDLVMEALNQPSWSAIHAKSLKNKRSAEDNLLKSTSILDTLKGDIELAKMAVISAEEGVEDAKDDYAQVVKGQKIVIKNLEETLENGRKTLEDLKTEKRALGVKLKALENKNAEAYQKALAVVNERKDAVGSVKVKVAKAEAAVGAAEATLSYEKRVLNELANEPDNCPKCGKPWDKEHSESEIQEQKSKIKKAEAAVQKATSAVESIDSELQEKKDSLQDAEDALSELDTSRDQQKIANSIEEIEDEIDRAANLNERTVTKLENAKNTPSNSAIEGAKAVLKDRQERLRYLESKLERSANDKVDDEELLKVADYWVQAFSPRGIPNRIIRSSVGPMNETARRISKVISDSRIGVSYIVSKELSKGGSKPELSIEVSHAMGSNKIGGNSKGERSLSNLIVAETLSEIGRVSSRVGWRWYDEVTNGLPVDVRRRTFAYLRDLAKERGILIFVVDHSPEAATFGDHVLTATKGSNGTQFHWS